MDQHDVDNALFAQALIRSVFPSPPPRHKWSPMRLFDRLVLWWRGLTERYRYYVCMDSVSLRSGDVDCWVKARVDTKTGEITILESGQSIPSSLTDRQYANLRRDSY